MLKKIGEIKKYLNQKYVEREEIIDAIFLSIISRQHCLLIGPPGTGKSALVTDIVKCITGIEYFQWLLSRFSTPEELFGPVSLKELEQGVYKRNTAQKMPEAHLAFVDEIFKANSAILNSLLTLINERLFYNNGTPYQTPLISVIGASNEYPEEGEGLEALFDRFLLRFEVDYIGEDSSFIEMLIGASPQKPPQLMFEEIDNLQMFSGMVTVTHEVIETLAHIRTALRDEGVRPSDRRFRQSLSLLQAKAMLDGRQETIVSDIQILKDGLWETVDQKSVVHDIVRAHTQDKLKMNLEEIEKSAREIFTNLKKNGTSEAALEASQKMKSLLQELKKLSSKYSHRLDEIKAVRDKVEKAQKQIASAMLGI